MFFAIRQVHVNFQSLLLRGARGIAVHCNVLPKLVLAQWEFICFLYTSPCRDYKYLIFKRSHLESGFQHRQKKCVWYFCRSKFLQHQPFQHVCSLFPHPVPNTVPIIHFACPVSQPRSLSSTAAQFFRRVWCTANALITERHCESWKVNLLHYVGSFKELCGCTTQWKIYPVPCADTDSVLWLSLLARPAGETTALLALVWYWRARAQIDP